jgi:hypothetical protein
MSNETPKGPKGPANSALTPKKVAVSRGGRTHHQTVYVNPPDGSGSSQGSSPSDSLQDSSSVQDPEGLVPVTGELINTLISHLTPECNYSKLYVLPSEKPQLNRLRNASARGLLLFPRVPSRLPHMDSDSGDAHMAQSAAEDLTGKLLDHIGGKEKHNFFDKNLDKHFAGSSTLSNSDRDHVNETLGDKTSPSVKMTALNYELKRLHNKMHIKPSAQILSQIHKLETVQKAMRDQVGNAIYSNLDFNKSHTLSLKAHFPTGTPANVVSAVKQAAVTLKKLIPQSVFNKSPLKVQYTSKGGLTKYEHNEGYIVVTDQTTPESILREYGKQIQATNPNIERILQQHYIDQIKGSKTIDLNKIDPRYPKGTYGQFGNIKQPALAKVTENDHGNGESLSVFTQALHSQKAFTDLYKENPAFVHTVLGSLYGSRETTPKQPHGSGITESRMQHVEKMIGYIDPEVLQKQQEGQEKATKTSSKSPTSKDDL